MQDIIIIRGYATGSVSHINAFTPKFIGQMHFGSFTIIKCSNSILLIRLWKFRDILSIV